jgi:hypothetical protein
MKKKVFTALFLAVSMTNGIYAQQLEKLTYEEFRTDGTYGRFITVEAIFAGWLIQQIFMEGNYEVTYQCFRPYNEDKWSDWEFAQKKPAMVSSLLLQYQLLQKGYNLHPKSGMKFYLGYAEAIKMWDIHDRAASPFRWAEDGKSFFIYYKLYLINLF